MIISNKVRDSKLKWRKKIIKYLSYSTGNVLEKRTTRTLLTTIVGGDQLQAQSFSEMVETAPLKRRFQFLQFQLKNFLVVLKKEKFIMVTGIMFLLRIPLIILH